MGAASGLILSSIGAAYGSSKPNIFHSQCSSSTNKQLPEWENADSSSSSFNYQNKCKLSGIIPFIPIMIAGVLAIYGFDVFCYCSTKQLHQMITIHQRGYAQFVWRIGAGIHLRCIWHLVLVLLERMDFMPFLKTNHHHSVNLSVPKTVKLTAVKRLKISD